MLSCLLSMQWAQTQNLDVNLTINSSPPQNPFIWDDAFPSIIETNIFNNENDFVQVFIMGTIIEQSGVTIAQSSPSGTFTINLPPLTNTTLNGIEGISVSSMDFFDPEIINSQMLPPGNYEFCIDVVDAQSQLPIEMQICAPFTIQGNAPPDVIGSLTINGEVLANIFNWDGNINQFTVDITNLSSQPNAVIVVGTITGVNGDIARTNVALSSSVPIQPGNNTFSGVSTFPVANMDILDPEVQLRGILPPGDYDICLDIIWAQDEQLLYQVNCELFTIEIPLPDISCNLTANTTISPNFSSWDNLANQFLLEVMNNVSQASEVLISAQLSNNNGLLAQTNMFLSESFVLNPGVNNLTGSQSFPVANMDIFDTDLLSTNLLMPGQYELCITINSFNDPTIVLCETCLTFQIESDEFAAESNLQCPTLIAPADGSNLSSADLSNTIFQWLPAISLSDNNFQYVFKVFEILPGQSKGEAFQNNTPILEEIIPISENIFIWPSGILVPNEMNNYAWTVTISDNSLDPTVLCSPQDIWEWGDSLGILVDPSKEYIDSIINSLDSIGLVMDSISNEDHTTAATDNPPPKTTSEDDHTTSPTHTNPTDSTDTPGNEPPGTTNDPPTKIDTVPPLPLPENPRDTFPPEKVPPDTFLTDNCNDIVVTTSAASNVSLGMVLEEAEKFLYPRAVALRAEGIDIDFVTFTCTGCSAQQPSIKEKTVRDLVGNYQWEIVSGKGKLNVPFDVAKMDSLEQEINKILQRLSEIEDSLIQITADTAHGLPNEINDKRDNINGLEKMINAQKDECDSINTLLIDLKNEIKTIERKLVYNNQLHQQSKIDYDQFKIQADTLLAYMNCQPSQAELAQQQTVKQLRDEYEAIHEQLIDKQSEILNKANTYMANLSAAQSALATAADNYNQQKAKVDASSKKLRDLEAILFADPAIRSYIAKKRDWELKSISFINIYATDSDQRNSLVTTQRDISQELLSYIVKSPAERASLETALMAKISGFHLSLISLCTPLSEENRTNCYEKLLTVATSKDALIDKITFITTAPARISAATLNALNDERNALHQLQNGLKPLETALKNQHTAVNSIKSNYEKEIAALELQKDLIFTNLTQKSVDLGSAENQLNELKQARLDDLDQNHDLYLNQLENTRIKRDQAFRDYKQTADSIAQYQNDTIEKNILLKSLENDLRACEHKTQQLEDAVSKLEEQIKALEEKIKQLADRAKTLEKEKSDLEKALDAIKKEQSDEDDKSNKTAEGALVYYIPPPLEEILQHPEKFDSLKLNVQKAEIEVQKAYIEKEAVQGKLVNAMESTAYHLESLKNIKSEIDNITDRINQLNTAIADEKTGKKQALIEEYTKYETQIDQKEEEIQVAQQNISKLKADSIQVRSDREQLMIEVENKASEIAQLEEETTTAQTSLNLEVDQQRKAENTLERNSAALKEANDEHLQVQAELALAQKELAAVSTEDDAILIANAMQKITQIENRIKSIVNNKIPTQEALVNSASNSVQSATLRVKNARTTFDKKRAATQTAKQTYQKLKDDLILLNDKILKVSNDLRTAKETLKDKEGQKQQLLHEQKEYDVNNNETINNDASIKLQTKNLAALKESLESLKIVEKKENNAIKTELNKKDDLIKKAEEKLQAAIDSLKIAKDELTRYLKEEELDVVKNEVVIKLTGKDHVVDGWRSKDGTSTLVKTLVYDKKRVPEFKGGNTRAAFPTFTLRNTGSACNVNLIEIPDPPFDKIEINNGLEPRTIALRYKDGQPLWKYWPVIPSNKQKLLSMDVVKLHASFVTDNDTWIYNCVTQTAPCQDTDPKKRNIVDLHSYNFGGDGHYIARFPLLDHVWWEPAVVEKPLAKKQQETKCIGTANEIQPDDSKEVKNLPWVTPGVLIEATEEVIGAPNTSKKVQARIVQGDHHPLAGETLKFEVSLTEGESEGYGFGGQTDIEVTTDGDGYAITDFDFGDGFARFDFKATWHRSGNVIETEDFKGESPIKIKLYKLNNGPPDLAWKAAEALFDGKSISDALASMSDEIENKQMHTVAGLLDHEKEFVNKEKVIFESSVDRITLDPEEDETRIIGIGRSILEGLPEEDEDPLEFEITAQVEPKYEPLGEPAEDQKKYNTKGIKFFYIGNDSIEFKIELEEVSNPQEIISGPCKIVLDPAEILAPIKDFMNSQIAKLKLEAKEIQLAQKGETADGEPKFVAIAGKVIHQPEEPISFDLLALTFSIDSLALKANFGAEIGGKASHNVDHPYFKEVGFHAMIEPTGNFIGTLVNLPEIEVMQFKLKEGSAFTLDMHDKINAGSITDKFTGVVIHSATLELPKALSKKAGNNDEASSFTVKDFYIGSKTIEGAPGQSMAFGGDVKYNGVLFDLGFGGFGVKAGDIEMSFADNALTAASISGVLDLPKPFVGSVKTIISYSEDGQGGSTWQAAIETEDPVVIPKLETTFTLIEGTAVEYNTTEEVAKFRMNAIVKSEKFTDFKVQNLVISTDGNVSVDQIDLEKAEIKILGGFGLTLESLGFDITPDNFSFNINGQIDIFDIAKVGGSLIIASGPTASVSITEAAINYPANGEGPVVFAGDIAYEGREFKAKLALQIKGLLEKGIDGLLIVGATEDEQSGTTYNYWYTELIVGTAIAIPNTGLSVLELGGGVGNHYNPPFGDEEGSPSLATSFALKAIMGFGNTPTGEIFAGRVALGYTQQTAGSIFTIYGKLWLLKQEESIYGEGRLNLDFVSNQVDGYVKMKIGLPDAEGDIFDFNSRIEFLFSQQQNKIESTSLEGSVFKKLIGTGKILVDNEKTYLDGNLKLDYNTTFGVAGLLAAIVDLHVSASGTFNYTYQPKVITVKTGFQGIWDVDLDTPFGIYDILDGSTTFDMDIKATDTYLNIYGKGSFEYNIIGYSGTADVEFKYNNP